MSFDVFNPEHPVNPVKKVFKSDRIYRITGYTKKIYFTAEPQRAQSLSILLLFVLIIAKRLRSFLFCPLSRKEIIFSLCDLCVLSKAGGEYNSSEYNN